MLLPRHQHVAPCHLEVTDLAAPLDHDSTSEYDFPKKTYTIICLCQLCNILRFIYNSLLGYKKLMPIHKVVGHMTLISCAYI